MQPTRRGLLGFLAALPFAPRKIQGPHIESFELGPPTQHPKLEDFTDFVENTWPRYYFINAAYLDLATDLASRK